MCFSANDKVNRCLLRACVSIYEPRWLAGPCLSRFIYPELENTHVESEAKGTKEYSPNVAA